MANDYNSVLNRMMSQVPDTLDKRQGSVIYNAIAPAAMELSNAYAQLNVWLDQTYLLTATGQNLDNRGADFSIPRLPGSYAVRIARMYDLNLQLVDIGIGTRYADPTSDNTVTYTATSRISLGTYELTCEQIGSIGDSYTGNILPLFIANNLGRAEITSTAIPGADIETDDAYRARIIARMGQEAFGGNIADYKRFTKNISGVGDLKVYPVWDTVIPQWVYNIAASGTDFSTIPQYFTGGGTVKLSVIDVDFNPCSPILLQTIKDTIDPSAETGLGVGIAPIGHVVTVVTPDILNVDVAATVSLDNRTIGEVQLEIETAIDNYLLSIRQSWGSTNIINVYRAVVTSAILSVPNVINVTNLLLNGLDADILVQTDSNVQQLPFKGTVTLS